MPVHDWTRVDAGVFHDFHNVWIALMRIAFNSGLLPEGFYAMSEQHTGKYIADVLTLLRKTLTIRHVSGKRIVALVEIVSPANKDRQDHVDELLNKLEEAVLHGIHLLVVDLFPPGKRDPVGLHSALLARLGDEAEGPPSRTPLTLASYVADVPVRAYWEYVAIGSVLPPMPLFLDPGVYIETPLETTYQTAWKSTPAPYREALEGPMPRRKRGR